MGTTWKKEIKKKKEKNRKNEGNALDTHRPSHGRTWRPFVLKSKGYQLKGDKKSRNAVVQEIERNAKSSRSRRSDVMVFSRERFDPSEKAVAEAAFTKIEADQVVRSRI